MIHRRRPPSRLAQANARRAYSQCLLVARVLDEEVPVDKRGSSSPEGFVGMPCLREFIVPPQMLAQPPRTPNQMPVN